MAHYRIDFATSIFNSEYTNGEAVHCKFIYAMQKPVFFAMQVIVPCIDDDVPFTSDEDCDRVFEWSHRFKRLCGKIVYSDSLDFDDENASVYVLMDAVHRRGGLLLPAGRWVPIGRLLMSMLWPGGEGTQAERDPLNFTLVLTIFRHGSVRSSCGTAASGIQSGPGPSRRSPR